MSFLDNLENNLKSLESRDERGPQDNSRREEDRARAAACAPWASKLKRSAFVETLLAATAPAAHRLRSKIYIAWLDTTLRLESRGRKLDLRPTPRGVLAVFLEDGRETHSEPVDLDSPPADLFQRWLDAVAAVPQ